MATRTGTAGNDYLIGTDGIDALQGLGGNDQSGGKRIPSAADLKQRGGSHVSGPTTEPLLTATIPALLAATVAAHGAREAAVFTDRGLRMSWNDFAARVDRLATGLLDLGIGKGDRVGIWSPNRPEWLLTQFATARIGAILVNVNPAYRVCADQGRRRRAGPRRPLQDLGLPRHDRAPRP